MRRHAYQFNLGFSTRGWPPTWCAGRATLIALSSFQLPGPGWTPQALQAAYANVSAVLVNARYGFGALTLSADTRMRPCQIRAGADQFRDATQAVTAQGGGWFRQSLRE